ncbi:uncharacterized protein LOC121390270 [Gigantopelta aegis]|uniref:uncharacterized protein LOC121390270 n=1 Tax=Gigantopelta aegis TaxID=1735272 RepID=UPI001B88B0ED|nr:uncharacterized protein LOC121390270 [Gigantopelta aegis]
MKGLVDSANGDGDMIRNCTNHTYCMIETFHQPSGMFSFIRDCSNNDSYSFELKHPVTITLPPKSSDVANNKTVCGTEATGVFKVCVLLCDHDFCNGPTWTSSSNRPRCSRVILLSFLLILWFSLF